MERQKPHTRFNYALGSVTGIEQSHWTEAETDNIFEIRRLCSGSGAARGQKDL